MTNHLFVCGNNFLLVEDNNYDLLLKCLKSSYISGLVTHFVVDLYPITNDINKTESRLDELKKLNIVIHQREFGLKDFFKKNLSGEELRIATGAFIRMEVPNICKDLKIKGKILYTDYDVFFLQNVEELFDFDLGDNLFACSSEFHTDKLDIIYNDVPNHNTGVMIMNVDKVRKSYSDYLNFIKNNLRLCIDNAYDQGAINIFYKNKIKFLPIEYNWKPYWGPNYDAKILHWHGPKPFSLNDENAMSIYRQMINVKENDYNFWIRYCEDNIW